MKLQLTKKEEEEIIAKREAAKEAAEKTKKLFGKRNDKVRDDAIRTAQYDAQKIVSKETKKYNFIDDIIKGINELSEKKGLGKVFLIKQKHEKSRVTGTYYETFINDSGTEARRRVSIEDVKYQYPVAIVSKYLGETPNCIREGYENEEVEYSLNFEAIYDSFSRVKGYKVKIDNLFGGLPGTYSQRGWKSPKTILDTILEDIESLQVKKSNTDIQKEFRAEQTAILQKKFPGAEISEGHVKNHWDTITNGGQPNELFEVKTDKARITISVSHFEGEDVQYTFQKMSVYDDIDVLGLMKTIL